MLMLVALLILSTASYRHRAPLFRTRLSASSDEVAAMRTSVRRPTPTEEQTRFESYTRLRHKLHTLVQAAGCDSRRGWVRAFERWQYLAKTYEMEQCADPTSSSAVDPLIPSMAAGNPADALLVADLQRLDNMPAGAAERIAAQIVADSARLSKALATYIQHTDNNVATATPAAAAAAATEVAPGWAAAHPSSAVEVSVDQHNGDLRLRLRAQAAGPLAAATLVRQMRVYTLGRAHAEKLHALWRAANKDDGRPSGFYEDVFCLLVRYAALEGKGWQAAVPRPIFPALQAHFGVVGECFASPLNTHLPLYCSLFPDVDMAFGSVGSFFSFSPSQGSYEANPPFVPQLMVAATDRFEALLRVATGPLSFAVVVPAWTSDPHYPRLLASPHCAGHLVVHAADHAYCDGHQHESSLAGGAHLYRPAPFDTAVFFLQNAAGRARWPLTPAAEADLRRAFQDAKPAEELLRRQADKGLYVPKGRR